MFLARGGSDPMVTSKAEDDERCAAVSGPIKMPLLSGAPREQPQKEWAYNRMLCVPAIVRRFRSLITLALESPRDLGFLALSGYWTKFFLHQWSREIPSPICQPKTTLPVAFSSSAQHSPFGRPIPCRCRAHLNGYREYDSVHSLEKPGERHYTRLHDRVTEASRRVCLALVSKRHYLRANVSAPVAG